jgi:hypothetical protein
LRAVPVVQRAAIPANRKVFFDANAQLTESVAIPEKRGHQQVTRIVNADLPAISASAKACPSNWIR